MKNTEKPKKHLVDDKSYWKERHAKTRSLKASGIKSIKVRSNEYVYKLLAEQYKKLLNDLDISNMKSVIDCGFGDGYFLKFFKENFPQLDVYGIDISKEAKKKIDFISNKNLYVRDLTKINITKKFDIVHSFDVLYHILSDSDYDKALSGMANLSLKHVILHERFMESVGPISSKHVRMRRSEYTNQILNAHGFYLSKEMPSHFFAMRLLTYRINNFTPGLMYKIDKYIADNMHPSTQESLASHYIRVYTKR